MHKLIAILTLTFAACAVDSEPPYNTPMWGDPCNHNRAVGPNEIVGCTHASDGSGDVFTPGREGVTAQVGICAIDDTCRPLCGDGCPEGTALAFAGPYCYCATP
jgi:hypothetical protein